MDIKEFNYKRCAWYKEDKCELPSLNNEVSECVSKENPHKFCVWVAGFVSNKEDDEEYRLDDPNQLAPDSYMKDLFERAMKTIQEKYI